MRRSTRASVLNDRTFAVRCRVEIPLGGMRCLDEMYRWSRSRVGWNASHLSNGLRLRVIDSLYRYVLGTPARTPHHSEPLTVYSTSPWLLGRM